MTNKDSTPRPNTTTPVEEDTPSRTRATPWYTVFEDRFLPVLKPLVEAAFGDGVGSRSELHERFRELYDCSVPYPTFRNWIQKMGFEPLFSRSLITLEDLRKVQSPQPVQPMPAFQPEPQPQPQPQPEETDGEPDLQEPVRPVQADLSGVLPRINAAPRINPSHLGGPRR